MDSDDEREELSTWKGISGCVVIINSYDPAQQGAPAVALEATREVVRLNMRCSKSNIVGLCVYGVKDSNTSTLAIQNMVELLPLATPSLENFKKLCAIDISSYRQSADAKLSEVFWHCSRMFANCKRLLSERSVIMLTRLDTPPTASDYRPTLKRVVDLVNLGIQLNIINISKNPYVVDPFYVELMKAINRSQDVIVPPPVWDAESIIQLMQQRSHKHLATARLSLELGEGLTIGVGVYSLCRPQPMPKKVNVDSATNDIVSSNILLVKKQMDGQNIARSSEDGDTAGSSRSEVPLLKSEKLHYQVYGNEKIEFTNDEFKKLSNPFGSSSMKLLGFKPNIVLRKEKWFLKQCAFLYPNESIVEGSTKAFKALHRACSETSVIAICIMQTRVNAKPRIVALSPCTHPLGLNIEIGFDIIFIPYLENLKDIPQVEELEEEDSKHDDSKTMCMKNLIEKLLFDYKADLFENPKLQSLYRAVEALALEEDSAEQFTDTTKPRYSRFDDVDPELFAEVFGPFNMGAIKRPAAGGGPAAKRVQVETIDESLLRSRVTGRQVHRYNVSDLKQILRWKHPPNLPALTGVKKDELVHLVYQHCK